MFSHLKLGYPFTQSNHSSHRPVSANLGLITLKQAKLVQSWRVDGRREIITISNENEVALYFPQLKPGCTPGSE